MPHQYLPGSALIEGFLHGRRLFIEGTLNGVGDRGFFFFRRFFFSPPHLIRDFLLFAVRT